MAHQLTEGQNVLLGITAAFVEGIILQPTLYWKNARAQGIAFTMDPRLLYRGTAISIFNECQIMGLQFGVTSFVHKSLELASPSRPETAGTNRMVAAALSGVITSLSASPVELVMVQQQRFGGSFYGTPYGIIKNYGMRGIMRGITATAFRDSLYVAGMLGVTPLLQDYFSKDMHMSDMKAGFYASILGGLAASLSSQPFDVIKTNMQADIGQITYRGFLQSAQTLLADGGWRRLYRGSGWRAVNLVGTICIANECRVRLPAIMFNVVDK